MTTKVNLDSEIIFQQQRKARDKELVMLRTELVNIQKIKKELKQQLLEISCKFEKLKFQISELKKYSAGKSINLEPEMLQKTKSLFE